MHFWGSVIHTGGLKDRKLELHLCSEALVLYTFVAKHYIVISIGAANVTGCTALQGIAEMTNLMDNTIEEMQLRCFLVSASHS